MTGNIPSPLLAGERDRLKVLEGWERPPSCLDRGRGGASGPAKFKCHAQESEFPDIQLPRNRISRNNQDLESWVTMIATMKINLQNVGMKTTQTGWQRCKYLPFSEIEPYFCLQKYPGQGVRYWRGDFLPRIHFCTLPWAITRNIKTMDLQRFLAIFQFFKHLSWFV